jgi:hypothetical protein
VNLDLSLSGPTGTVVAADFAHPVDLTSTNLKVSLPCFLAGGRTDLIIFDIFGFVVDTSIKGEEQTDTVCLDLQALEYGAKERTGSLSWCVSPERTSR